METLIIEGTLAEVQERLGSLPLSPQERVRLTIQGVDEVSGAGSSRNGVALIPTRDAGRVVTTELVRELLDAE